MEIVIKILIIIIITIINLEDIIIVEDMVIIEITIMEKEIIIKIIGKIINIKIIKINNLI